MGLLRPPFGCLPARVRQPRTVVSRNRAGFVPCYCTDNNRVGQTIFPLLVPDYVGTIEGMKNKPGRPPKAAGTTRAELLEVRLQPAEKQTFKEAAELAGLPLSGWVRERLRAVARQELEGLGRSIPFLH